MLSSCSILALKSLFKFISQYLLVPYLESGLCKDGMSWITAISLMHSQDIDVFGNIIVKLINIKLFDFLACCHYILNPPRTTFYNSTNYTEIWLYIHIYILY